MGWIAIGLLIGSGCYAIVVSKSVRYSPLTAKLFGCCLLLLVPLFYSQSLVEPTIDRMLGVFGGLLFFISLQQFHFSSRQQLNLLLLVIAAVWIEIIFGWSQVIAALLPGGISGVLRIPRPAGIFQQVNVFASFIAAGLVLSGYVLAYCVAGKKYEFRIFHLPLLFMPLATVHLLNAGLTRVGWLGASLGVVLILPYMWKNLPTRVLGMWCSMILLGFILSWSFTPLAGWQPYAKGIDVLSIDPVRVYTMPQVIDMIKEKPLTGYGYGKFEASYLNYTAARHAMDSDYPAGLVGSNHPHNELLFWAVEGGLLPLVGLLLAAFFVWQRLHATERFTRLALVGIFFPIVLHTQVELPFYYSVSHWIVFILLIFWVDNLTAEYRQKTLPNPILIGAAGILIPVFTTVFMVTTLHTGWLLAKFESGRLARIEDLQKMSNPVIWQDRIQWAMNSRLVVNALATGQPELAKHYIQWAPEFMSRVPRPNSFKYLILAYQITGEEDKAKEVQQQAYYLFPNVSFELPDIAQMITGPAPTDNPATNQG